MSIFGELPGMIDAEERYLRKLYEMHGVDVMIRAAAENTAKIRVHLDNALKVIRKMQEEGYGYDNSEAP